MKKLLLILVLAVMCSSVTRADNFDDAYSAYNKGNYTQAIELFRPLATQGSILAQYNLGVKYAKGEGVLQDYVRAHMWFNLAASKGDKGGRESREIVAKKMTPSKISEAQDMAKDCKKKNYKNCE